MTAPPALQVAKNPADAGFDPARLVRLDTYLDRCVTEGSNPGSIVVVARHGAIVHMSKRGLRDPDMGLPVEVDTIWRLYSMTKPVTSVAAMMLWEEGQLSLSDPVHAFIPSFADTQVYESGSLADLVTVPAAEPITIWHLLTHTAGMTVTGLGDNAVNEAYRAAGIPALGEPDRFSLPEFCDRLASLPLLFQPGTAHNYSHATDVLGRIVELVSGKPLEQFMDERIFGPLGMTDTGFTIPDNDRVAAVYRTDPSLAAIQRIPSPLPLPGEFPKLIAGGHGLASTAPDYYRFVQMLAGASAQGSERLLAPRTVALMAANHLPGNSTIAAFGHPPVRPAPHLDGRGFGLGFAPLLDPVSICSLSSPSEYGWGGAAGTNFWIDPTTGVSVLFMMQVMPPPGDTWVALRRLVNQALVT